MTLWPTRFHLHRNGQSWHRAWRQGRAFPDRADGPPLGQHGKERQLRPPVSFAECVDDVQFSEEVSSLRCELGHRKILEGMIGFQFFKKLRGPGVDIFREAKWTALFGHPDRPRRPCPFVDGKGDDERRSSGRSPAGLRGNGSLDRALEISASKSSSSSWSRRSSLLTRTVEFSVRIVNRIVHAIALSLCGSCARSCGDTLPGTGLWRRLRQLV